MSVLSQDLYGRILSNRYLGRICSQKVTAKGGFLESAYDKARIAVNYFCAKSGFSYAVKKETQFLTAVAYLTYVPYGKAGYAYLQTKLGTKSVTQARRERLEEILGEVLSSLDEAQREYIFAFLEEYEKEEIDLTSPRDGVCLICRAYHEIEGHYDPALSETKAIEQKNALCYEIADLGKEKRKILASEFLSKLPSHEMTEADERYIDGLWL